LEKTYTGRWTRSRGCSGRRGYTTISECKSETLSVRDEFEQMIKKEEQDRIAYHTNSLDPLRTQIRTISEGLMKEKKTRIANEK
jgi:hypothetical protein